MRIIIATSDKTSYILEAFAHQYNKYCDEPIDVLGYSHFPQINFPCISLSDTQLHIGNWCKDLYSYIHGIEDEFVIFGLDDFIPTAGFDYEVLNKGLELMIANDRIGRFELGAGHQYHITPPTVIEKCDGFDVYKYAPDALYKISTQFSVWRSDYLLKQLNHDWSPWDFEVIGSREAAMDGYDVIATTGRTAWSWVWAGAISSRHPNRVNISGLKDEDVKEMIALKILNIHHLQYGMEIGQNKSYE